MSTYTAFYHQLFGVRRSVRYHQRRRSYFETLHTCIAATQVVCGSSAIAALFANATVIGLSLTAVPPLLAAVDLVFGTTRKATLHAGLGRQFSQLEADLVPYEDESEELDVPLADFQRRRLAIEADEPPKLRVVDLLSHNDLVRGTYTHGSIYPICSCRRLLGHIFDINVDKELANAKPFLPFESGVEAAQPA